MLNLKEKGFLFATAILTVTTAQAADVKPLTRTPSVEKLVTNSTKARLKELMRAESATLQKETTENSNKKANLKHNIEALKALILEDVRAIFIGKDVKKWDWTHEEGMHNHSDLTDATLEASIMPALVDILDTYPNQVDGTPVPHDPAHYMEKTSFMPHLIPTAAEKGFKQHRMPDEGMVHYFVKMNIEANKLDSHPDLIEVISEAEKNLNSKKNEVAKLALKDKEIADRILEIQALMMK